MSVLTRIRNNQILDATIYANAKIVPGSIVGTLFNSNLTTTSDVTIGGNLTVLGTSTYMTVASTNTYVNDPLIVLNNAFSGTNTYDLGFIFNRGSLTNQAFIWDESSKEFSLIGTAETGTTYGNVSPSSYANLHIGNLSVDYATTLGTLSVGSVNTSGNVLASTVLASLVTANDGTFGNVDAGFIGNVGTAFSGASLNVSGNVSASTLIAGQINTTGNVLASTVGASFLTASTATIGNISAVTIGNAGAYLTGGSLNITGNVLGGLAQFSAINSTPIGNATPSTAAFTTLTASGVTTVTNATPATGLGTGALQVSGGASVAGNLWVGGNLNVVGNSFTIISNAGVFYGDANGFGALYAGTAGYTPLPSTVVQTSANFNGYAQNNFENLSTGAQASTDWVATAGDGTDIANYIDMGIVTANWDGTQDNSLTNAIGANDGYLYVQGNTATGSGGNLTIGASTPGTKKVSVIVGGNTASSITAVFRNPNTPSTTPTTGALTVLGGVGVTGNIVASGNVLAQGATTLQSTLTTVGAVSFTNTTNSTGTSNGGALTVAGGAAIAKDLWVGGNVYAANIIGTSYQYLTIVDPLVNFRANVTYPYNYDIGFYSSFVGGPANVEATSGVVRDDSDGVWKFFSNVSEPAGGTLSFDSNTLWDGVKAGNLFLTNTTDASSKSSGALIVTGGAGVGASLYARDIQATVIGNVAPAAGFFTQLNSTGNVVATDYRGSSLNVTGNVSASGGIFATVGVTGGIWANSATESTSTSTGSIVSAGGLGLAGNIFQGGAYHDTSSSDLLLFNTPSTVNVFRNAIDINIGNNPGTLTFNSSDINGAGSINLFNTSTSSISFAGEANVTMGAPSGVTIVSGGANVRATTASTDYDNGALLVQGGVGVRGNLSIRGSQRIQVGQELIANTYPEDSISVTTSANSSSRISIQNINAGTRAVSEFTAMNDVGSNTGAQVSMGIVSSEFARSDANIYLSNDSYILGTGNLLVQTITPTSEVKIVVGGVNTTDHYASFSALNSNVSIVREKISTSHTTGAFTVTGGVGLGSNLNVARGAVINNTASGTGAFQVKGTGDSALIVTDPLLDSVVIGGSGNATVQPGIGLKVGGTGAIMIPIGTNSQRPGTAGNVDVDGMMRLNSSSGQLEYYIGGSWQVAGSSFTLIAADSFAGDGANVAYTLGASATTSGVIVSINGVVQIPVTSYSVSGTTLTFTEAPAVGDSIDVRRLTTTATVNQLSSGFTLYDAQTDYANIATGNVAQGSVTRLSISSAGDISIPTGSPIVYNQTGINIAANATPYVVASFSQTAYTTAKYIVQVKNSNTNFQSMEAMVLTDQGGNAYVTTYAIVNNGTMLGSLTANVVSGSVKLWYTNTHPSGINSNVKVQSTYII